MKSNIGSIQAAFCRSVKFTIFFPVFSPFFLNLNIFFFHVRESKMRSVIKLSVWECEIT